MTFMMVEVTARIPYKPCAISSLSPRSMSNRQRGDRDEGTWGFWRAIIAKSYVYSSIIGTEIIDIAIALCIDEKVGGIDSKFSTISLSVSFREVETVCRVNVVATYGRCVRNIELIYFHLRREHRT